MIDIVSGVDRLIRNGNVSAFFAPVSDETFLSAGSRWLVLQDQRRVLKFKTNPQNVSNSKGMFTVLENGIWHPQIFSQRIFSGSSFSFKDWADSLRTGCSIEINYEMSLLIPLDFWTPTCGKVLIVALETPTEMNETIEMIEKNTLPQQSPITVSPVTEFFPRQILWWESRGCHQKRKFQAGERLHFSVGFLAHFIKSLQEKISKQHIDWQIMLMSLCLFNFFCNSQTISFLVIFYLFVNVIFLLLSFQSCFFNCNNHF